MSQETEIKQGQQEQGELIQQQLIAQRNLQEQQKKGGDSVKLWLGILILIAGFILPKLPINLPDNIKLISPIVGVALAFVIIGLWSNIGRRLIAYIHASVKEFKKVAWPKRQEALKSTYFVMIFVAFFGLYIYGVDTIIAALFNLFVRG